MISDYSSFFQIYWTVFISKTKCVKLSFCKQFQPMTSQHDIVKLCRSVLRLAERLAKGQTFHRTSGLGLKHGLRTPGEEIAFVHG